jgi:NADP-dependent 3-hydroxy acid dehydrogenase YdfG
VIRGHSGIKFIIFFKEFIRMKVVVLTGGTRGIGFGLAKAFLGLGCPVMISGRNQQNVDEAVKELASQSAAGRVCDVRHRSQVQALWDAATQKFGRVDIWVNNAGVSAPQRNPWQYSEDQVDSVIDTNIKGTWNGINAAVSGMLKQGYGAIYSLEGLGSDGKRHIPGTSLYAASKAALRYLDDGLRTELKKSPIITGAILPGMVLTDLVMDEYKDAPEKLERFKPILNILASRVDEVAPVLAQKILDNTRKGARIHYLSSLGVFLRFLEAPFRKRDLFQEK